MVPSVAEYLTRALHLLALSTAPGSLSPDPAPGGAAQGVLAGLGLSAVLVAAVWLRARVGTRLGAAAAAGLFVAVAAALVGVLAVQARGAPLGAALSFVAPPWWLALALSAAATAHRRAPRSARTQAALVVGGLVLVVGTLLVASARRLYATPAAMWARAAAIEPAHVEALGRSSTPTDPPGPALAKAEACLAEARGSCACLGLRGWALLRLDRRAEAQEATRAAVVLCPDHRLVGAVHAHALALAGEVEESLAAASTAWRADATPAFEPLAQVALLEAEALAFDGMQQRRAALFAAERAVDVGGGRSARLLAAAIAIGANAFEHAQPHLDALLAANPLDADALYDRALVHDRRGDYDRAREGYLEVLRTEPRYAVARYNLAVLTWRRGVVAEARHHVELFVRDYPQDPRGVDLRRMVQADPAPTRAPSDPGASRRGSDVAPAPSAEGAP